MKKAIEWNDLSRYRGELMGIAMLFIILFHVYLPRQHAFFGLHRLGNVGVDMFFFLSGIGLWFSWTKPLEKGMPLRKTLASPLISFYKKRYWRIYPAWLVMASLYYIPIYCKSKTQTLIDLIGDISINWDFWIRDELTFWYIPATMMLYMIAPFYMELIRRHPLYRWLAVAMVCWCVIVQWVTPVHQAVGHIEIFWSRVPIFLIGLNVGELVKNRQSLDSSSLWLLLLMFALPFAGSLYLEQMVHGKFPLFAERMLYIPMTVSGTLLLCLLLKKVPSWLNSSLSFIGGISLEIYLIHAHFVLNHIQKQHLGYWPTFLLTVIATIPLAWLLSKATEWLRIWAGVERKKK